MTKLEELKADYDAAYAAWDDAAEAAYEAALDAAHAARVAADADGAACAARGAYYAELKKTQEENTSD